MNPLPPPISVVDESRARSTTLDSSEQQHATQDNTGEKFLILRFPNSSPIGSAQSVVSGEHEVGILTESRCGSRPVHGELCPQHTGTPVIDPQTPPSAGLAEYLAHTLLYAREVLRTLFGHSTTQLVNGGERYLLCGGTTFYLSLRSERTHGTGSTLRPANPQRGDEARDLCAHQRSPVP